MRAHLHPPAPEGTGDERLSRAHHAAVDWAQSRPATATRSRRYLSVGMKLRIAVTVSLAWVAFSIFMALPWIDQLAHYVGEAASIAVITLIAFVPGAMNAFIVTSLLIDRRPPRRRPAVYPGLSVLIAAYNEEKSIAETVVNVMQSGYAGPFEIIVIDDGSTDRTVETLAGLDYPNLRILRPAHGGKAAALNCGLAHATYDLIATIDADTYLYNDALSRIVERILSDPPNTAAVAGAVLVRNSRDGVIAKVQEWDYFHGIAAVKRAQSLYQGTLVAQGAFSVYHRDALLDVGGWPATVGEDIVLTWGMLSRGKRIGYAEDAAAFTNVPTGYKAFFRQRQRWARGLIEAFRIHPDVLVKPRMNTIFIYWNLLFPLLDFVYLFVFLPGVIAAMFGNLSIAGPMTIAVLPLALLINYVMYRTQRPMFAEQGLAVRRNFIGFLWYMLVYSVLLQPATIAGYASEAFGLRKSWGTK